MGDKIRTHATLGRMNDMTKTLIPIFALTMLAQGLAIATRAAMSLSGQTRPKRPKGVPPFFKVNSEDTL